jgi:hypothetical protein
MHVAVNKQIYVNEYIGLLHSFYKGPKKVMLILQFLRLCKVVVDN